MKVIIVGGGVGGLDHGADAACARHRLRGLRAGRRHPRARRRHQHAAACDQGAAELGLLERLDAVAIRTYELFYTNRFGQEIWREPRGIDAGYDVPQFSIHRGRLQGVIYQAARARLGESRIHTGHGSARFTQDDGGVTAYFFDRDGSHRANRARRRADRRRRHPFARARKALPERRPAALERLDAVARRDRLAAVPDRPLDGDRRRAGGEVRALSDRRRHRAPTSR